MIDHEKDEAFYGRASFKRGRLELSIDDALDAFFTDYPEENECKIIRMENIGTYTREHFENIDMHPED